MLVAGAGIAGLAAAGAIRELGWDVSVVEQRADFDGIGTRLFVPANGVQALAALGVLDEVACRGRRIDRLRLHSADGAAEAVARLDRVWPGAGPSIAIHWSLMQEALLEAALVPVRTGVRLTGVVTDGPGSTRRSTTAARPGTTWSSGPTARLRRSAACCGLARRRATAASRGSGAS